MNWKKFLNEGGLDVDSLLKGGRTLVVRLSSGLALRGRLLAADSESITDPLLLLEDRSDNFAGPVPTRDIWVINRDAVEAIRLRCEQMPMTWDGFTEALKEE